MGRLALRAPWFLFLVGMAAPAAALAAVVTVRGTTGDDVVSIQPQGPDRVLIQLNGEDVASAASGDTVRVSTGPGRDRIFDEVEDFELNLEGRLGSGDDRLRLSGLRGRVVVDVDAGLGFDRMWGGPGADQLFGNKGNDTLEGLAGNDRLIGGEGDDRLIGGEGDDTFVCGPGNDTAVVIDHNDVDENCETIKRP